MPVRILTPDRHWDAFRTFQCGRCRCDHRCIASSTCGTLAAAEPDLGASFQHRDDHGVGDADGADDQGYGAQAEEQPVECGFRGGAGDQRVGGSGDGGLVDTQPGGGGGEYGDRFAGAGRVEVSAGPPWCQQWRAGRGWWPARTGRWC